MRRFFEEELFYGRQGAFRYEPRKNRKIIYVGITDNPKRRTSQHDRESKRFNTMNVVGPAVTQNSVEKWEQNRLESYRRNHGGKNPLYNKTDEG